MDELEELARSAGVEVVDVVAQHRNRVDPKFLIGSGRLAGSDDPPSSTTSTS